MEKHISNVKINAGIPNSPPFYEPPLRKTSAEIINEAKAILTGTSKMDSCTGTNVRPLYTERPFTPKEKDRIFFGKKTRKNNRPPSSFSLRYLQDQTELIMPATVVECNTEMETENILMKADRRNFVNNNNNIYDMSKFNENKIFNLEVKEFFPQKLKLPALESIRTTPKTKKNYKSLISFETVSDANSNYRSGEKQNDEYKRNAFSSPQERTNFSDNRSEGSFSKMSRQNSISTCLTLQPRNLDKLFGNKQIIENSETLFEKTEPLEPFKNLSVQELLDVLNCEEQQNNENHEYTVKLLKILYQCLQEEQLSNNKISSTLKITILKCLYRYVEAENQKLLINVAKILLLLKVTGNNLSGVCKLIFKVSKNVDNDLLFLEEKILDLFLDALGRSSPLEDAEACIYGYGAIKFLTTNLEIVENLLNLGILPLIVLHMKIINNAKVENNRNQDQINNVLFQITGALRNLASNEANCENFITTGAITQLCTSLKLFLNDFDIISTTSRNLSCLSSLDKCCNEISECDHLYATAIEILEKYAGNEEIIVRVAYTLGNTVARNDSARTKLYRVKNCTRVLIKLWRLYLELTLKRCSMKCDTREAGENYTVDVMIKIIRIIANLSMNATIGKDISKNFGVQLIDELLKVLISNPFKRNDDLVLSVLTTLNNISYYYIDIEEDVFYTKEVEIMDALREYITGKNKENKLEAMRTLGNLSRSKITRSYIVRNGIMDILTEYLCEDDRELLETTIGVFVNLMSDSPGKEAFRKKDGVTKLTEILRKHGQQDWNLSTLVCQTIWNYCIDVTNFYDFMSDNELETLMTLLADRLDEEKLFGIKDVTGNAEICSSAEFLVWEEFAFVATNLLEKIEHFLELLETSSIQLSTKDNSKKDASVNVKNTTDSSTNLSFATW
ncbi:armadillo repeat-containing protein 2 isoform X2 [Agrilus planipennis]|uniref:Armadillo repeat-containing protein 2 isoform X2 n=1 Tax=Agrilus planipennis TaxID=224129 RepID=A0A1W4XN67_AGRPL|nr:armadillo repeat-containing protein 2 isoform X2 [Agrilus planipennis]